MQKHSPRLLFVVLLFATSGLAANVSCSGNASGNWRIINQNVTCQEASALNMSGNTVYIYGASNVTFYNVTNTSIKVNVYNTSNFTANNVSLGSISAYDSAALAIFNNSLIYFSTTGETWRFSGSFVNITGTRLEQYNTQNIFDASYVEIVNSSVTMPGTNWNYCSSCRTYFNASATTYVLRDTNFYANYYDYPWNNTINFTGCAVISPTDPKLYNIYLFNLTDTDSLIVKNISYNTNNYVGYMNYTRGSSYKKINSFNSSFRLFVTAYNNATAEVNDSETYLSNFVDNSTARFFNSSLWFPTDRTTYQFSGSFVNLTRTQLVQYETRFVFNATYVELTNSVFTMPSAAHCGALTCNANFSNPSATHLIRDSTISNSNVYFSNGAVVNATNTSFTTTKSFYDNATLHVKNYFNLFVNDSAGRALRNVTVTTYNATSGEVDFNGTTDAYGWLNNSALLGYKQNATQVYNVMLTVDVTAGDATNQTSYNMVVNRWYNATMVGQFNYFVGAPSTASFTPTTTVQYGNDSLKPWNGSRQVELRTGTALVANFSWNFSAGDLNLSNVTVARSDEDHYVGINGTNVTPLVASVWVPVWGKTCNVKVCSGKANFSHCSSSDWVAAASVQVGDYCLVAVNGTVVQDRPTAITTKMVIKVPGWDEPLVAVLFGAALVVFALRRPARTACIKKK